MYKRKALQTLGIAQHLFGIPGTFVDDGSGDGDGDDGGGGGDPRSFSQDEVNSLLAKERKRIESKFRGYDDLKAKADRVDDIAAELAQLREEAELKDKSAGEREKILAEKAREQSAKRIKELEDRAISLEQERDKASANLVGYVKRTHAGEALAKAGVLQSAGKHALRAFLEDCAIELDADGNVVAAEYGGVPQKDLSQAASAFLNDNDIFKQVKPGGAGTRQPNGAGPSDKDIENMSASELASMGWLQRPAGKTGPTTRQERDLDRSD